MTLRGSGIVSLAILAVAAFGSAAAASISPPPWVVHGRYSPTIDPANFVSRIDIAAGTLRRNRDEGVERCRGWERQLRA
jgi:hypothetical protein